MKSMVATILTTFVMLSAAYIAPVYAEPPSWSEIVDGIQGRLLTSKGQRVSGSQLIDVYLELKNVSDVLTPVEIYYDTLHSVSSCQVVDTNGKMVQQTSTVVDIMQPDPFWLVLPRDSSLRFKVSVSGYGISKDAHVVIQMPCGYWALDPLDADRFLQVIIGVRPPNDDRRRRPWRGTLSLPKATIPN